MEIQTTAASYTLLCKLHPPKGTAVHLPRHSPKRPLCLPKHASRKSGSHHFCSSTHRSCPSTSIPPMMRTVLRCHFLPDSLPLFFPPIHNNSNNNNSNRNNNRNNYSNRNNSSKGSNSKGSSSSSSKWAVLILALAARLLPGSTCTPPG